MHWRNPRTAPLTRIDIVSQVPSESGVYGIFDEDVCLVVGDTWNLKARLLELINVLQDGGDFYVMYELCSEEESAARKQALSSVLIRKAPTSENGASQLPGISFWNSKGG